MKWIILGIGTVALAAGVIAGVKLFSRSKNNPFFDTDSVDGGVVKRNDGAAFPKTVSSAEITSFHCEFSLIAYADEIELEHGVYKLKATLNDGVVKGSIDGYGRGHSFEKREFVTDPSFMDKLYGIVTKYDFAKYNGCTHTVSGLPDMYGARLDIYFASGESIYTHDNQSNFLPLEAMYELEALFVKQSN